MSSLEALVYVSSAKSEISQTQTEQLLAKARKRNTDHNITGLLMYIDGNFMQYIEGAPSDLSLIYEIITNDPLHSGIIKLLHTSISERDFEDWSMAYCTKTKTALVGPCNDNTILDGKLGNKSHVATPTRKLLYGFWSKN